MTKITDLTGQRFHNLKVIKFLGKRNKKRYYWLCKCDCGNMTEVEVSHLKSGHTKSCGCMLREINKNVGKICYKNGLSNTKLSFVYNNMINRCYREKDRDYKYYGARGIKVCDEWLRSNKNGFPNFCSWAFKNGYKEEILPNGKNKWSLDRIDVNSDYSPENCRWTDIFTQANNKSNTIKLKINGEIDTISNWCRRLNVKYYNLHHYANGGINCKYPDLKIEAVK